MKIVVIDGHPDPTPGRFVHALADACAAGAVGAGHTVRRIDVSALEFALLSQKSDFETGLPDEAIRKVQADIAWCEHLVLLYPLWLGDVPARLKGLLEQVFRPGFAFAAAGHGGFPRSLLKGRSARVVVTMGMPAAVYRWYFGAHSVKSLRRNVLAFCGFGPVCTTLIGNVEGISPAQRREHLDAAGRLGRDAR